MDWDSSSVVLRIFFLTLELTFAIFVNLVVALAEVEHEPCFISAIMPSYSAKPLPILLFQTIVYEIC